MSFFFCKNNTDERVSYIRSSMGVKKIRKKKKIHLYSCPCDRKTSRRDSFLKTLKVVHLLLVFQRRLGDGSTISVSEKGVRGPRAVKNSFYVPTVVGEKSKSLPSFTKCPFLSVVPLRVLTTVHSK